MRQKCVKMGFVFVLLGKEERSKMRQKCVKNAFGGEHLLDDTEKNEEGRSKICGIFCLCEMPRFNEGPIFELIYASYMHIIPPNMLVVPAHARNTCTTFLGAPYKGTELR